MAEFVFTRDYRNCKKRQPKKQDLFAKKLEEYKSNPEQFAKSVIQRCKK